MCLVFKRVAYYENSVGTKFNFCAFLIKLGQLSTTHSICVSLRLFL